MEYVLYRNSNLLQLLSGQKVLQTQNK